SLDLHTRASTSAPPPVIGSMGGGSMVESIISGTHLFLHTPHGTKRMLANGAAFCLNGTCMDEHGNVALSTRRFWRRISVLRLRRLEVCAASTFTSSSSSSTTDRRGDCS